MSAQRRLPNVLTIPPGVDFLSELVLALHDGRLGFTVDSGRDPFALADTVIYVPTRRAALALRAAFAADAGHALLLPKIVPLGGLGEIEDRLLIERGALVDQTLPPSIEELDRKLHLARLTASWSAGVGRALVAAGRPVSAGAERESFVVGASLTDALGLAGDLAGLIDEALLNGVGWEAFSRLAPDHDLYWQFTTDFLKIVSQAWPGYLADRGLLEPAERQNRLLQMEIARLEASPPSTPVIVAGSTGSIPATARLIRTIAGLPAGAVVLPGLDLQLDAAGWRSVGIASAEPPEASRAGHPQAAMKRLLERISVTREEVHQLGMPEAALADRQRLVSEALRPAETTDHWIETRKAFDDASLSAALQDVALIETVEEHEEALTIAILLRQAVEQPDHTAALITPDRKLARRVAAELERWDIRVEDSAGCVLADTPAGTFARLAAAVWQQGFAPQPLLELLNHIDTLLGWPREEVKRASVALELGALRGVRVSPGLAGLRIALEGAGDHILEVHAPAPVKRITADELELAGVLLEKLSVAFEPLCALPEREPIGISTLFAALRDTLLALSETGTGAGPLLERRDGIALLDRLDELASTQDVELSPRRDELGSMLDLLLRDVTVPPGTDGHPRLHILGLLEARLLPFDTMILGSLNEGSWPPVARSDAFLNRPMRMSLGLDPPERRIGQTAHDFSQALGAPRVFLTRSERADGAPTVASRFIRRLSAFIGDEWKKVGLRGAEPLNWARNIDQPDAATVIAAQRPEPKPPVEMRPARLSVTAVETLYRDPYAIYARDILKLSPLDPVTTALGARDRGDLIHQALGDFLAEPVPEKLEDRLAKLVAHGETVFAPLMGESEIAAFWWPRFLRMAEWFIADDAERRPFIARSLVEIAGKLPIDLTDGSNFTLSGRADRIDELTDGTLAILDYKTGMPPGVNEVLKGFAPQLTLEAAMVERGAFKEFQAKASVSALTYLRLSGTGAGGAERAISPKDESLADLVERHFAQLTKELNRYRKSDTGYRSRIRPRKRNEAGEYDHLARVREWSETGGESDSEAMEGEG